MNAENVQLIENLSRDLYLKKQKNNSLRHRFERGAASAILATSTITLPVDSSSHRSNFDNPPLVFETNKGYWLIEHGEEQREIVAYDHEFDQKAYMELRALSPEIMVREKERLDSYTDKQLETILAERLNVLTNTFYYDLKEGKLWGKDTSEPALKSYKRGRDYRRKYGNPIDYKREDAEIEGFQKVEDMLSVGKSVLSISPKGGEGSTYQHNFYDVFNRKGEQIEVKRFSSGLSIEDYKKILGIEEDFTDADFLASPIDISGIFDSAEDVHAFLHKDHEFTDTEFFENVILPSTMQQRHGVLRALFDGDEYGFAINFNGMFNLADDLVVKHENVTYKDVFIVPQILSEQDLEDLGQRKVKEKAVGCGTSSGVKLMKPMLSNLIDENKFSVSEFGNKNEECEHCKMTSADNHYHCPGCNKKYADETSKTDRTEECACGFEFGCKKDN